MLDLKFVRNNLDEVKERLANRGEDLSELDRFGKLDDQRRELIQKTETLKQKRNSVSEEVAKRKREKEDAEDLIAEMRDVSKEIKSLDEQLAKVEEDLNYVMMRIPNLPHESVPIGEDEDDNVEIRKWGEVPSFAFDPKAHWDVGVDLGILDFERAAKVTGSRFVFYKGLGATA